MALLQPGTLPAHKPTLRGGPGVGDGVGNNAGGAGVANGTGVFGAWVVPEVAPLQIPLVFFLLAVSPAPEDLRKHIMFFDTVKCEQPGRAKHFSAHSSIF